MTEQKGFNEWLAEIAANTAETKRLMGELVDMARGDLSRTTTTTPPPAREERTAKAPLSPAVSGAIVIEGDTPTQFELTKTWELEENDLMVVGNKWERVSKVEMTGSTTTVETHAGTIRTYSREEFLPVVSELGEVQGR